MADITRPRVIGVYGLSFGGKIITIDVEVGAASASSVYRTTLDVDTGQLVVGQKVDGYWKSFQPKRGILLNLVEAVIRWIADEERPRRVIPRSVYQEKWAERGETRQEHEEEQ